ncbi:hypothetical protein [Lentzea sp. NBRC 105346]|uniref:hypothetical protein n=1 Tax=Lentzea sp. NBRC 105346 TaxID=3032205 RepID=UPI0025557BD8|nr:hypothetical protein [Lentzea sp. NBRC 105346]
MTRRTLIFLTAICAVISLSTAPASASTVGSATFTDNAIGEVAWTNVPLVGMRLSGSFTDGFHSSDASRYEIVIVVDGVSCTTEMDGVTISPPAVEAFTIPTTCSIDSGSAVSVQQEAYMRINDGGDFYAQAPINEI